jgi:hypothetical protein
VPELKVGPIRRASVALIVGNGPTAARCPWPAILNGLLRDGCTTPDVWLINGTALGRTVPEYAVAVDMDIVESFTKNGLHEVATVVTGHQEKVCAPDRWSRSFGGILDVDGFRWGSLEWPPLASGPLATWAASALGYESILLYGLDGSLSKDADESFLERIATWEAWLRRWREARPRAAGRGSRPEVTAQKLLRVWPIGQATPLVDDPLRDGLDGMIQVAPA